MSETPAQLGYYMPAEWEPHAATWLSWPHNRHDWPGKLAPIPWVYGEIVRNIVPGEIVRIMIDSPAVERSAARVLNRCGAGMAHVEFIDIESDRSWTRDTGPMFVAKRRQAQSAVVDFHFNGWSKYPDHDHDAHIPATIATRFGRKIFDARYGGRPFTLEGGAIDVNGRGSVLTTEECLLDQELQPRNPGLSRPDIEAALGDYLGAKNVIWLGRGIVGDDTHGHIDDLCRFVSADTIVLCREDDKNDANYALLEENRERLQDARLENGQKPEVIALPMPAPLYLDGHRLPASYANFYIANRSVLVPTFNDPNDRIALGILADLFPNRRVVGIHAVDLVWGLGTIHCMTQQEPAPQSVGV